MIKEIMPIGGSFSGFFALSCPAGANLIPTLFPTAISVFRINNMLQLREFAWLDVALMKWKSSDINEDLERMEISRLLGRKEIILSFAL